MHRPPFLHGDEKHAAKLTFPTPSRAALDTFSKDALQNFEARSNASISFPFTSTASGEALADLVDLRFTYGSSLWAAGLLDLGHE